MATAKNLTINITASNSMNVSALPGGYRLLGALAGLPVVETEQLRYDEMSMRPDGLVVGEARHLLYRMKMIDLNQKCREAAATQIEATARRILGEPWEVSPR